MTVYLHCGTLVYRCRFHHDLKADDVLVQGNKFILTDFGLSRIDADRLSSGTSFKPVRGNVVLECEDLDVSRTTGGKTGNPIIRRSSDIWSLACIMAEVLTFMLKGSDGLAKFEEEQRYDTGNIIHFRFHNGKHQANLGLQKMFQLEPERRPRASQVARAMEHIALRSLCQQILDCYKILWNKDPTILVYVEQRRFLGWFWSWKSTTIDLEPGHTKLQFEDPLLQYSSTLEILLQKMQVLSDICQSDNSVLQADFRMIGRLNDKLLASVSLKLCKKPNPCLVSSLLRSTDQHILDKLTSTNSPSQKLAEITVSLQRLNKRVKDGGAPIRPDLRLDNTHFNEDGRLGQHTLGHLMTSTSGDIISRVLIERKSFPKDRMSDSNIMELATRLEFIADLLAKVSGDLNLSMLNYCCGYGLDTGRRERGLVYKSPHRSLQYTETSAATLHGIIKGGRHSPRIDELPTLGDRFCVATVLAKSLLQFHLAQWVRETISSHNIAFFYRLDLLGRQATPSAFTEGPDQNIHSQYQHPEYQTGSEIRFREMFDYYSLGDSSSRAKTLEGTRRYEQVIPWSPEELQKGLRDKEVPQLGFSMGVVYRDIVDRYLSGELESSNNEGEDMTVANFAEQVVEALDSCSA
ncbi:hypothetical protein BKA65DRAFT_539545 [Rhexocercosporidium sp. MPI-PUGE-AT-0058]|nr:hypothetical protein BKA65DRAFT_539545 [Rhexocercosporidium sp. MPI-PUGE-AT-0058]